ncbi:MAG: DUF4831 family protein [Bacteroidales bacterium]|nr:DUF4831 family protein [Bacteroidales bacterium]
MKTNILKFSALAAALMLPQFVEAQKNIFVRVENIQTVSGVKYNPVVYSLPKTVLSVKVTAVNEISVKGPYSQYAQKYLGTDEVITANASSWSISKVEISSYPVKDSTRTFVVETNYPCAMNFSRDGFLESVNTTSDYKEENRRNTESTNFQTDNFQSGKIFQDINVNRYETVFDTVLHVIDADSVFTAVPTQRTQMIRKSLDEQAQELANQIFVLRDDRKALLVGESDGNSLPSGDALKFMIEQLNKLEEKYMSMFIGKKIYREKTYVFDFEPDKTDHSQNILFKFSPEYGIQARTSLKGNPVMIDVTNLQDSNVEKVFNENQKIIRRREKAAAQDNGFAYLSPASGKVKIIRNGSVISEKVLNISQMGLLRYIPQSLVQNPNFKMVLYPDKGTLKSLN